MLFLPDSGFFGLSGSGGPISAVNQRGRENKGPPDIVPKSFSKRAKMVLCSFHRSHGEICTRNRPVSETKFLLMISGGPFLSRPLCFTNDDRALEKKLRGERIVLKTDTFPGKTAKLIDNSVAHPALNPYLAVPYRDSLTHYVIQVSHPYHAIPP